MDVPRAALSPEARRELATLEAFMRDGAPASAESTALVATGARGRAREALAGVRDIPVDIRRLAEELGYPVHDRPLAPGERGTIGRDGSRVVISVSSHPGYTNAERRWIIAEELGHALLGHTALVASSAPGAAPAVPEPRRRREERDARAFASEILMPEEKVRARFTELSPRINQTLGLRQRETETDDVVLAMARMFGVTPTAMRLRLDELQILR